MKNPYSQYKTMQVTTTDPVKLVVLLYEGSISALKRAKEHIALKNMEAKGKEIMRAHDILFELLSALDHEKGGEIADNLQKLYVYMIRRLLLANGTLDTTILDEVSGLLDNLLSAWRVLAEQRAAQISANAPDQATIGKTAEDRL
ncbi:MAG: flagellar export chaperone FliS [Myxococcales bacterium]|nr:MAG: flagellar export chaperone FliS [Myxococcales bacterium]